MSKFFLCRISASYRLMHRDSACTRLPRNPASDYLVASLYPLDWSLTKCGWSDREGSSPLQAPPWPLPEDLLFFLSEDPFLSEFKLPFNSDTSHSPFESPFKCHSCGGVPTYPQKYAVSCLHDFPFLKISAFKSTRNQVFLGPV